MDKRRLIPLALCVIVALAARAQTETRYEPVLVPFDTLFVEGAHGDRWSAELRVRNSGDIAVNLFPDVCYVFGRPFPCTTRIEVPAGTTHVLDVFAAHDSLEHPGVVLYVPEDQRANIDFSLTVRNLAAGDPVGTAIPIVRAAALPPRSRIIGVPIDAGHRFSLRVYNLHAFPNMVFRVKVIDEETDTIVTDREYSRVLPSDPPVPPLVPAAFDFSDALSAAVAAGARRVTVIIEKTFPQHSGFWPMISVTSNRDGRIAVFTPQ